MGEAGSEGADQPDRDQRQREAKQELPEGVAAERIRNVDRLLLHRLAEQGLSPALAVVIAAVSGALELSGFFGHGRLLALEGPRAQVGPSAQPDPSRHRRIRARPCLRVRVPGPTPQIACVRHSPHGQIGAANA